MRLRAVPDQPKRAIGYVRVSAVMGRGDDLMSPQIQAAAIRDHCQRNGHDLVAILEDTDLSGRLWKSRQIEDAIGRIEARDVDTVVVWKWSRVSRNRKDWAIAVDRVESAGGTLESATEPFDDSSAGRFARGVLAELAAFESERIGDSWRETHRHRFEAGLPPNGRTPWGWVTGKHAITPDPEKVPVVRDLYSRYIGGQGFRALAAHLTLLGWPTTYGGAWAPSAVKTTLDSPVHAGWVVYKGERRRGAHEPIIDQETWDAYMATRRDARGPTKRAASEYLLSGLVQCWCGSLMHGANLRQYRCPAVTQKRAHAGGYVSTRKATEAVMAWLETRAAEIEAHIDDARATPSVDVDAGMLEAQIVDVDRKLAALTGHLLSGVVNPVAYAASEGALISRRTELTAALQDHMDKRALVAVAPPGAAVDLLAEWDTLSVVARRAALRQLVDRVEVQRTGIKVYPLEG